MCPSSSTAPRESLIAPRLLVERMLSAREFNSTPRNEVGVAWGPIVNGQAEIAGMPAELLETFSKRTSQVDAALAVKLDVFRDREGRDPTRWERAALTREASADTRAHKTGNGATDLQTRWTAEAAALGWTAVGVSESVTDVGRELSAEPTPRVTTAQVVEALSVGGSTWNRADVIRALCDVQRPLPGMPASRWAHTLERVCDAVTETCVELDPVQAAAPRRVSDGRSLWLEPVAAHFTTEWVLAEEEYVLSWALGAQNPDPQPSVTVERGRTGRNHLQIHFHREELHQQSKATLATFMLKGRRHDFQRPTVVGKSSVRGFVPQRLVRGPTVACDLCEGVRQLSDDL